MHTRNRIFIGFVSTIIAAGGVALAAVPANAAPAYCPSGYSCTWGDVGYSTSGNTAANIKFTQYIPNYAGWNYAGTNVNGAETASSIWNNGNSEAAYFYKNPNKTGAAFRLAKNTGDSNMHDSSGAVPGGFQDTLSSGYFYSFN